MTSTVIRAIAIAIAAIALAASTAAAKPVRDPAGIRTSSLAGTVSPGQDLRNPDQRAPAPPVVQDLRNPDQRAPAPPATSTLRTSGATAADGPHAVTPLPAEDDGPSPLVYILPSVGVIAMLATALGYVRVSRRAVRA